jgi:hypothetical protein
MRITRPCAGDDPFKIEALEQHELLLSDMSLAPPDRNGKCRRLYNRLGAHHSRLHLVNQAYSLQNVAFSVCTRHTVLCTNHLAANPADSAALPLL